MEYKRRLESYCSEYWKIENYELAKADNFKGWECHHRLELTINGEFAHTIEELIRLNMYYNRPHYELIFLTISEHRQLHHKTDYYRNQMSKAKKGHTVSNEARIKMSAKAKGRFKGLKWKVIDGKRVWYKEVV